MSFSRTGAATGLLAAPVTAWWCARVALDTGTELTMRLTADAAVVFVMSALGAAIASYLTVLTLAVIASRPFAARDTSPRVARAMPRAWRSLLSTALGVGIAAGVALPATATSEPDTTHIGWLPASHASGNTVGQGETVDIGAEAANVRPESDSMSPHSSLPEPPNASSGDDVGSSTDALGFGGSHAASAPPKGEATSDAAPGQTSTYTVERGDSLWRITARLLGEDASTAQIAEAWPRLYEANRSVVGSDPSLIYSGQVLQIPASLA